MRTSIIRPLVIFLKHFGLGIFSLVCLFMFSACTDDKQRRQQSLDDLKAYVKAHKDSIDNYVDTSWTKLDQEFSQKKAPLETDKDKMSAEMKESYNGTLRDWDSVKADYTSRQAVKVQVSHAEKVRKPLYIKAPDASPTSERKIDFSDLTANEMEPEYQNFVDVVRQYKDDYTTEDWTMVNKIWKDLNRRRIALKNSISVGDTKKIMRLKLDYTTIKAINRPIAVSENNLDE